RRGPDFHARVKHTCRKHQYRRQLSQGGRFPQAILGVWVPAQSWLGIDGASDRRYQVGMEPTLHRQVEWPCWFQQSKSNCRGVGPRARPSWLQRLLPPLLGGSAPSTPASELVRRVNAEGELDIGQLTIEKLKLEQVQAKGYLHDLQLDVREAQAEWAGGKVRG